jgi:amino acid transporter
VTSVREPAPSAASDAHEARLTRRIGWIAATAIVINSTIGTGIFQRPAAVVREAGSLEAGFVVWVLGAIIALCGALSVAELAVRFPRAGGLYEPLRQRYGERLAFVYGWAQVALLAPSAIGSFCLLGAGALGSLLGWPEGTETPLALAILALVVGSAMLGTRFGAAQQTSITAVKYAGVITLAVVGLALPFDPTPVAPLATDVTVRTELSVAGMFAALIAAMWAYDGWADLTALAGEVREPRTTLPRALVLGTVLVGVSYLLVVAGAGRVLGLEGLRNAGSGANMTAMLVAERTAGTLGRQALALLIAVSATGGAMASVLTHSRAFVPMATDGNFFRALGVVTERGVPARALLVLGALGAIYVGSSSFEALTDAFVVGYFPFYALAVLSVFNARDTLPEGSFRMPLFPLPPLLFLMGAAMVIGGALLELSTSALMAFAVLISGIPISILYRRLQG